VALCALAEGGDAGALDAAIEDLRLADSKHRLAFVLTRAGEIELARGEADRARTRALEAARAAAQLDSASEAALAQVLLARASAAAAGTAPSPADLDGLPRDGAAPLSAYARAAIAALVAGGSGRSARRKRGGSAWRT